MPPSLSGPFTKYCRRPLLALTLLLCSLSSHALDKVVLQLKWKHQFQFAGFYAAQTQGYFAEEGLEVDIREVDYNRSPLDIVMSGDAQFGISDSTLVLARLQGKKPVVLAAIFQHSPLVLLSLESSGIVSPLELKDKRVMYLRGTDDAVIRAMFTELGLRPIDYTHVPHTFNDQDLVIGKVDAVSGYITDQPFYFRQKGININVISPANYGIDFYGDMIFVEENYFRQNKKQALAFRRAAIRGWQYAIENQEEMVDWIRANLAPDKSKDNLMYEAETTSRIIKSDIIDLGYFSTNRLIRIADIYKSLNLVHRDSDFSGINYEDHLEDSVYQRQWIKITVVSIAIISFLALILTLANFRLKAKVREKTEKLLSATHTMRRYLKVIDQYVISCMMSADLRILDASKAMAKTVESQAEALKGKQLNELLHDQYDPTLNAISSSLRSQKSWTGELQMLSVNGKELWFEVFIEPENSDPQYQNEITLIATDISDRKRIEQLSLTDSLTGLANRRHLDSVLENEFRRMQRHKTSLSLLMCDVDFFKQFNDVYGHQQGDRCLQQISQVCKQLEQRPADLAVRYGGEEFILLLPETDSSGAKKIAHQLLENIAELDIRHKASSVAEYVTISIGVATVEKDTIRRVEDIIDLADKQLYKAKSAGRNCISSHHLSPGQ